MFHIRVPLAGAMLLAIAAVGKVGCTQSNNNEAVTSSNVKSSSAATAAPRPGTRITGPAARKLVADGAFLLDVRTPGEFSGGHIDGATNISVQSLSGRLAEVGADKSRPIVVYCRSGRRSNAAMRTLQNAGFTQVYDLGPRTAW